MWNKRLITKATLNIVFCWNIWTYVWCNTSLQQITVPVWPSPNHPLSLTPKTATRSALLRDNREVLLTSHKNVPSQGHWERGKPGQCQPLAMRLLVNEHELLRQCVSPPTGSQEQVTYKHKGRSNQQVLLWWLLIGSKRRAIALVMERSYSAGPLVNLRKL